jgi:hypothetical protein
MAMTCSFSSPSTCLLKGRSFAQGVAVSAQQLEARSTVHARLLEELRAALKVTEKTVNELAYSIQTGAIPIVYQSANTKYPQDCFLPASRFSAFFIDRNGVTGRSGSTGAT